MSDLTTAPGRWRFAPPQELELFGIRKVELEVVRNIQSADNSVPESELLLKLRELEEEYRLAGLGLAKGMLSTLGAMASFITILGMTIFGKWLSGDGILTGGHLVAIAVILAFGVIIYFSFVFGRRTSRLLKNPCRVGLNLSLWLH